jgi:drug/metabolite transporter (DMT)-like permease
VIGWALIGVMVFADSGSDILMARGMRQVIDPPHRGLARIVAIAKGALRNPSLFGSVACGIIHLAAFLALLSFWDLSLVIPAAALDYVVGTLGAKFLLGESVTPLRWTGVCLISAGVALASMS